MNGLSTFRFSSRVNSIPLNFARSSSFITATCLPSAVIAKTTVRSYYGSADPKPVENTFDRTWRKLNRQDREKLKAEYAPLEKMDWKQLTMDQKKALYTIAFDLPPEEDANHNTKVFLGVVAIVGAAVTLMFTLLTLRGHSPTWTQEHFEKREAYIKAKNGEFINNQ